MSSQLRRSGALGVSPPILGHVNCVIELGTGWPAYMGFWSTIAFNMSNFQLGASLLAIGLSWWQVFLSTLLGHFLAAVLVVAASFPGLVISRPFRHECKLRNFSISCFLLPLSSNRNYYQTWQYWLCKNCRLQYHISFPVATRMAWGKSDSAFNSSLSDIYRLFWFGLRYHKQNHAVYSLVWRSSLARRASDLRLSSSNLAKHRQYPQYNTCLDWDESAPVYWLHCILHRWTSVPPSVAKATPPTGLF